MPTEDGLTPSTAYTISSDSPFYEEPDLTAEKDSKTQSDNAKTNADSIKNIQVSSVVNPSPNTIVPLDNNGKMPSSTLPIVSQLWSLLGGSN